MKFFVFSLLSLWSSTAHAATKVAVIELGIKGTVRRTTSQSNVASVAGAAALVQGRRHLSATAGMSVVPDLFRKPDNTLVIGLSNVNVESMSYLNDLLNKEEDLVVGHVEMAGHQCDAIVDTVDDVVTAEQSDLSAMISQAQKKLAGIKMTVNANDAAHVDHQLQTLLAQLQAQATKAGQSLVIHLVVEEDKDATTQRRRLEEADQQQDNNGNNAEDDNNGYSGYYGYGYYNSYGEWITPFKTIFQIQYFNVVTWTAVGLTLVLFFTISLMMNMPLEPDTLLFGETAKLVGDD